MNDKTTLSVFDIPAKRLFGIVLLTVLGCLILFWTCRLVDRAKGASIEKAKQEDAARATANWDAHIAMRTTNVPADSFADVAPIAQPVIKQYKEDGMSDVEIRQRLEQARQAYEMANKATMDWVRYKREHGQ